MDAAENLSPYRLSSGGLFYKLMLRLRLVEPNQYHPWRSVALFSGLTWLPLLILTSIEGTLAGGSVEITFIKDPVPHSRFLIALPLLIFADIIIDPYIAGIIKYFQTSGLVPDEEKALLNKTLDRLTRRKNMAGVDVVLLILAFGLVWILKFKFGTTSLDVSLSSWISTNVDGVEELTAAGWWLVLLSIPLIQLIFYRWLWRLVIWISFLNHLSRIRLRLQPTHPDQVGGLGILSGGQTSFGVIFTSSAILISSIFASEIIYSGNELAYMYFEILGFILICFTILTVPLYTFARQLSDAKRIGLQNLNVIGYLLSEGFYSKWIQGKAEKSHGELVAGTDPSILVDYIAVYETVSSMRLIPLNRQRVIQLLLTLAVPFLPLILTEFHIKELLTKIVKSIV
jgi:hypothetical protein